MTKNTRFTLQYAPQRAHTTTRWRGQRRAELILRGLATLVTALSLRPRCAVPISSLCIRLL